MAPDWPTNRTLTFSDGVGPGEYYVACTVPRKSQRAYAPIHVLGSQKVWIDVCGGSQPETHLIFRCRLRPKNRRNEVLDRIRLIVLVSRFGRAITFRVGVGSDRKRAVHEGELRIFAAAVAHSRSISSTVPIGASG